jgi:dUTP pyrophosphatase
MDEGKLQVMAFVEGVFPEQAHEGDAGFDLTAVSPPKIVGIPDPANEGFYFEIYYIEYDTGVRISPPKNIFSTVFPRSSISKTNLLLANSVGLIDTGYRDSIKLRFKYVAQPWDYEAMAQSHADSALYTSEGGALKIETVVKTNVGNFSIAVNPDKIYKQGDRIGQLVFFSHLPVQLVSVSKEEFFDNKSSRGEGGFGSTGQ